MTDSVVVHSQEPPAEWVRRLREISPVSQSLSWLAFRWYAPAQRWVLYEMVPNAEIDPEWRDELEGPHPDSLEGFERICSGYQWDMYRQHRVHARPCWVLQGSKGGHLFDYDDATKSLCKAIGMPTEPPPVGSLPFAPFDERAVRQLVKMNRLTAAKNDLAEFKRRATAEGARRQHRDALKAARAEYVRWMDEQMEEAIPDYQAAYRKGEWEDAPVTDTDWVKADEQFNEQFIESGRL